MLPIILEAAIRSAVLIAVIWLGLTILRIRNPHIQMAVWRITLVASLLMPFLVGWPAITLPPAALPLHQILPLDQAVFVSAPSETVSPGLPSPVIDWRTVATAGYLSVAAFILLRLLVGIALTWRLCRSALPVQADWTAGRDVRASACVHVPVTFLSTILLPAGYPSWDATERRAVIAHESAHVSQGDFYVLLLASINRAVFWFNPLAWWLQSRIAYLAETRSDAAAIAAIDDRTRYAEILLDFGARAGRTTAGLAMAGKGTLSRRVEQILAETIAPKRMDWRVWSAVVACIVPLTAGAIAQAPSRGQDNHAVTLDPATLEQRRAEQRQRREEVLIDPQILDNYVGYYQLNDFSVFTVTRTGDNLFVQLTGQQVLQVYPESSKKFFYKAVRAQISFITDPQGRATALVLHQNGLERLAQRVDEAQARGAQARLAQKLKDGAPSPGSEAALRRQIEAFQQGQPAYGEMTDDLAAVTRPQIPTIERRFAQLGPLQSISFRGVGLQGWDVYEAKFANGLSICRIFLAADGKISGLLFQWGP